MSIPDATVIIRAAGERTEALCQHIVEKQISPSQIHVIKERPFTKAVQSTFELGIQHNRKWTLAIDADVIITADTIATMIANAEFLGEQLYVYQGFVVDKIFGKARPGGPHLYNTKHLSKALEVLSRNPATYRPESDTYAELAKDGFIKYGDDKIFGIHDYYQFHKDLFRKAYFHSKKHFKPHYTHSFIEHWRANHLTDNDYVTILHGWFEGILSDDSVENDIRFFQHISQPKLNELNITEKQAIDNNGINLLLREIRQIVDKAESDNLYTYISPNPVHSDAVHKEAVIKKRPILRRIASRLKAAFSL